MQARLQARPALWRGPGRPPLRNAAGIQPAAAHDALLSMWRCSPTSACLTSPAAPTPSPCERPAPSAPEAMSSASTCSAGPGSRPEVRRARIVRLGAGLRIIDAEVASDVCPLFFRLGAAENALADACRTAGFTRVASDGGTAATPSSPAAWNQGGYPAITSFTEDRNVGSRNSNAKSRSFAGQRDLEAGERFFYAQAGSIVFFQNVASACFPKDEVISDL